MSRVQHTLLACLAACVAACSSDANPTDGTDGTDAVPDSSGAGDAGDDTSADSAGSGDVPTSDVGDDAVEPDGDAATDGGGDSADTTQDEAVEAFVAELAGAVCGQLDACCDRTSQIRFFAQFAASSGADGDPYADMQDEIPPAVSTLDIATCTSLLTRLYLAGPFGSWSAAVDGGFVSFDTAAADACVASVADATCGAELQVALGASGCATIIAPEPGTQRPMFPREAQDGPCLPLRDGFGGLFYGTCDPETSFCCRLVEGECAIPSTGVEGICVATSPIGGDCSYFGDLQLCSTGLDCDTDTATCERVEYPDGAEGDVCFDSAQSLFVANCVNSWCDWLGTGLCAALVPDGAACVGGEECASGRCDAGVCAAEDFCEAP